VPVYFFRFEVNRPKLPPNFFIAPFAVFGIVRTAGLNQDKTG
jgi:hypothetical protein